MKTRSKTTFWYASHHLDLLTNEKPDERQIMTYVSCYYHAFQGAMQVVHWACDLLFDIVNLDLIWKDRIMVLEFNVVCYFIWIDVFLERMSLNPHTSTTVETVLFNFFSFWHKIDVRIKWHLLQKSDWVLSVYTNPIIGTSSRWRLRKI